VINQPGRDTTTTKHPWPDAPGPWIATLTWQFINGRPECTGLAVASTTGTILTASVLRRLPVADWIAEDRAKMAPQTPATGGLRKSTVERLTAVAEIYEQAVRDGKPPTKAVAEHYDISHGGASNLVSRARAHGLLPPTSPGVAVGTTKEQELAAINKMPPGPHRDAALAGLQRRWEGIAEPEI
jgi:hypothetical protein